MRWLKMVNREKCFEIKQAEKVFNNKPNIATTNVRTPPIQNSMLCFTKISCSENVGQSMMISSPVPFFKTDDEVDNSISCEQFQRKEKDIEA